MRAGLAAFAVTTALVAAPAPAHAEDQRPCVSKAEFNGLHGPHSQQQIEDAWEASANEVERGPYRLWLNYPACGYGPSEAGVLVGYSKATGLWVFAGHWRTDTATLHGQP